MRIKMSLNKFWLENVGFIQVFNRGSMANLRKVN